MELREKATALATKQAGRCTCALMDDGLDCPWCEVFYDVLQGYPASTGASGGARPQAGRGHLGCPPGAAPPFPRDQGRLRARGSSGVVSASATRQKVPGMTYRPVVLSRRDQGQVLAA
jgi:hypothetical protein